MMAFFYGQLAMSLLTIIFTNMTLSSTLNVFQRNFKGYQDFSITFILYFACIQLFVKQYLVPHPTFIVPQINYPTNCLLYLNLNNYGEKITIISFMDLNIHPDFVSGTDLSYFSFNSFECFQSNVPANEQCRCYLYGNYQ